MLGAKGAVSGLPQGMPRVDASQTLTGGALALNGQVASAPIVKAAAVAAPPVTVNATPPPQASSAPDPASQNFASDSGAQAQRETQQRLQVEGRVASERLQQAKMRIQLLQFRARSAAASGDSQEADRAAREAATVAREISQLAQQLTRSQGGSSDATSTGRGEEVVRRRRGASPETSAVAQGLLADAAPRGQIQVDASSGFLVEARALASQARTLVDLATTLHDQDTGKEPMFAPQAPTMMQTGEAFVASADKTAEVPATGAWADLAAAEDALEEASPVPAQPKKFAPEPGTLFKLSV